MLTSLDTCRNQSRILPHHASYTSVMHGPSCVVFIAWAVSFALHVGMGNANGAVPGHFPESEQSPANQGGTALHRAAAQGPAENVTLLLTRGADVNAQDDQGRTPLLVAIERGQIDAAQALLDDGADVEKQAANGVSPLYAAAFHGRHECLEALIKGEADVNARCALDRTALFPAVAEGHASCVRTLLKHGANANVRAQQSEAVATPLHGAAVEGQLETARILLDYGADPNVQAGTWKTTPLYLACVLGHRELARLLTSRGADPAIADASGITPAKAGALMAERSSRKLTAVTNSSGHFNSRAVVYLVYLGRRRASYRLKGARLAFAVGDGKYFITAAHCVDDFQENSGDAIAKPLLVSPHFGDLCQAEIVSVDQASDLAVLRASWEEHPALELASGQDVARARRVGVVGYPPQQEKKRLSAAVLLEQLSAICVDSAAGKRSICLAAARYVGPGWSGAPMVLPQTGKVAGVFSSHDLVQIDRKVVLHNLYGCDVQAIHRLLRANGIDLTAAFDAVNSERSSKPDEAFPLLLHFFERFMQGDVDGKLHVAHKLKALRPMSPHVRLLVALAAHERFITTHKKDARAQQMADENFRGALRLLKGSDSTFARSAYGCFLLFDGRPGEAAEQLREARRQAPHDTFIGVTLLRALTNVKSEEALTLGETLCRQQPRNHRCWFEYAGTLREFRQLDKAVAAAENSIRFGGPNVYCGRLASVLAKAGRLDEAESVYKRMLESQPHEATFWLWYARFLIQDRPQQQKKAQRAIDKAEEYSTPRTIPRTAIEELRAKIDVE